jgi:membrane protease YdiL (CAAX protease family)
MRERPLSYAFAFAWTFGATVLLILGLQATAALRPATRSDIVALGTWESIVYVGVLLAMVRAHGGAVSRLVAWRSTNPTLLVLGAGLGIALQIPAESMRRLSERLSPPSAEELAARAALLATDSTQELVVLLLIVAALVPFIEEAFFRGALFGLLRNDHSAVGAATVVGLCFMVSHPDYAEWLPLALVAAALSYLRMMGGSLSPCFALHAAFNATTVATHASGLSTLEQPLPIPWPLMVSGWTASAVLLGAIHWVGHRSASAERARAEDTRL